MINEQRTYDDMGYRSTDLSRSSGRKVWAICDNCGKERLVHFCAYSDLCHKCAMEQFSKDLKENKVHASKKSSNYCKLFDKPLKNAIRDYFDNVCFECGKTILKNNGREMSVHHVNYQKDCGCNNSQFCIYVPLCGSCHIATNHNRWYWYTHFMTELALRNPNYYAYHIPVVFYDEPSYNYSYVFDVKKHHNNTYRKRLNNTDIRKRLNSTKIKKHGLRRFVINITESQKLRIDALPEDVDFSSLVRNKFDIIIMDGMKEIQEKKEKRDRLRNAIKMEKQMKKRLRIMRKRGEVHMIVR